MAYAVAQISDLHIVPAGLRLNGAIDTAGFTRAAVEHLNRFVPAARRGAGDGRPRRRRRGRRLREPARPDRAAADPAVAPARQPRRPFGAARGVRRPVRARRRRAGAVRHRRPLRVVALDSSRSGEASGSLDAGQLAWLDATLPRRRRRRRSWPSTTRHSSPASATWMPWASTRRPPTGWAPSSSAIPRSSGCSPATSIAASCAGGTAPSPPPRRAWPTPSPST